MISDAPTGVSWETIPTFGSTPEAQYAEQLNICWRSTQWVNAYCNQTLRATQDTEELLGPDFRMTVDGMNTGLARFLTSRWPVTSVVSARWTSSNSLPPNWQSIPLNMMYIEAPSFVPTGISTVGAAGANAILIAPGYVTWLGGRRGYRVQATYVNGWAHTSLQADVSSGTQSLSVTDCTGLMVWNATNELTGASLWLYDGANTELVQVTSVTATTGPGAVTLKSGLLFTHRASTRYPLLLSSLPESVQQAGILYSAYQALVRGATATTVQAMPGSQSGGSGSHSATLLQDAQTLLTPYKRVI